MNERPTQANLQEVEERQRRQLRKQQINEVLQLLGYNPDEYWSNTRNYPRVYDYPLDDWIDCYLSQVESIDRYEKDFEVDLSLVIEEFYILFPWLKEQNIVWESVALPHNQHLKRLIVFNLFFDPPVSIFGDGIYWDDMMGRFIKTEGAARRTEELRGSIFCWKQLVETAGWSPNKARKIIGPLWSDIATLKAQAGVERPNIQERPIGIIRIKDIPYSAFKTRYELPFERDGFKIISAENNQGQVNATFIKTL